MSMTSWWLLGRAHARPCQQQQQQHHFGLRYLRRRKRAREKEEEKEDEEEGCEMQIWIAMDSR